MASSPASRHTTSTRTVRLPNPQPAPQVVYAPEQKSKLAAGLLGIFLGSLGVHNFYLGNTGKAVAQLLLTVLGCLVFIGPAIAGIWGLIEGILILCSSYGSPWHKDGNGNELRD
ncbi:TM2 domain-containing protein [Bifidobacterium merycicum]